MKRLVLSVDSSVIEQARKLAEENGTTVSAMFERFVRMMTERKRAKTSLPPIARKASGLVSLPRGATDQEVLADALKAKSAIQPLRSDPSLPARQPHSGQRGSGKPRNG